MAEKHWETKQHRGRESLTLPTGLRDRVSCTLAHHLGDVDRTVNTATQSDGAEYCFCLQLRCGT